MTSEPFGQKGRRIISSVFTDERTIPFLLGMGIEALGLAIQFALGLPAYPILDAIVVGILVAGLYYFQRKRNVQ
jgi:hypothetical protein